jgi:hypothetical protein
VRTEEDVSGGGQCRRAMACLPGVRLRPSDQTGWLAAFGPATLQGVAPLISARTATGEHHPGQPTRAWHVSIERLTRGAHVPAKYDFIKTPKSIFYARKIARK